MSLYNFSDGGATSVQPSRSPLLGVPSSTTESTNSQEETTSEKVPKKASTTPSTESDTATATEDTSELTETVNVTLSSNERDESSEEGKDKLEGRPGRINVPHFDSNQAEEDNKGPNSNESDKNKNLGHPTRAKTQGPDVNFGPQTSRHQLEDNNGSNKVINLE